MIIYYDVDRQKRVDSDGVALNTLPQLAYMSAPVWEIHLVNGSMPVSVSQATAWRVSVDKDRLFATEPMIRQFADTIDATRAAQGILVITLDTNTTTFRAAIDGKTSLPVTLELWGSLASGATRYRFELAISAIGAIDPLGGDPPEPASLWADKLYVDARVDGITPESIGAAPAAHTHTGYAPTNHTHTGYAATDHTHAELDSLGNALGALAASDLAQNTALGELSVRIDELESAEPGGGGSGLDQTAVDARINALAASKDHSHTPSSIGAAAAEHTHSNYATEAALTSVAERVTALEAADPGGGGTPSAQTAVLTVPLVVPDHSILDWQIRLQIEHATTPAMTGAVTVDSAVAADAANMHVFDGQNFLTVDAAAGIPAYLAGCEATVILGEWTAVHYVRWRVAATGIATGDMGDAEPASFWGPWAGLAMLHDGHGRPPPVQAATAGAEMVTPADAVEVGPEARGIVVAGFTGANAIYNGTYDPTFEFDSTGTQQGTGATNENLDRATWRKRGGTEIYNVQVIVGEDNSLSIMYDFVNGSDRGPGYSSDVYNGDPVAAYAAARDHVLELQQEPWAAVTITYEE